MQVGELLERVRVPDEQAAQDRTWDVVRSTYRERSTAPRRRANWRLVLPPLLAALAGGIALSPAGATIGRWVRQTLGVRHASSRLVSLPAGGRVLVSGPGGAWIISADGSDHRLGTWSEPSWSPHGLYVAAIRKHQLVAATPQGRVVWQLTRPAIADPRWYPPSGFRLAYLSGGTLRVIAGDGTGDHRLATYVAHVAPAWRPGRPDGPYELAYATSSGRVVVRDASAGRLIWSARPGAGVSELQWSKDGQELLVVTPTRALLYTDGGRLTDAITPPARILSASLAPDGRELALLLGGSVNHVATVDVAPQRPLQPVFSGAGLKQLTWSPNGRWLLITWPAADQWVFVRGTGQPRIAAVSRIAEQLRIHRSAPSRTSGQPSARQFPTLDGWCCEP